MFVHLFAAERSEPRLAMARRAKKGGSDPRTWMGWGIAAFAL
jgi:hypothetical protein